jgi:hypothetical protein
MQFKTARLQEFINLSVELCGLSEFTLRGTGYAEAYYSTVISIVGQDTVDRLLNTFATLPANDQSARDKTLRTEILSDEEFGPIARNIIKLWYVSTWFELPRAWQDKFGPLANDRTFIPFTYAYAEGLLGPAVGAHPPGAKPPGYGSWAERPEILEFSGNDFLPVAGSQH